MKRFIDFLKADNGANIAVMVFFVVTIVSMIPIWKCYDAAIPTEEEWSLMEEKITAVWEQHDLLLKTNTDVKIGKEKIEVTMVMDNRRYSMSASFDKNFVLLSNPTRSGPGVTLVERIILTLTEGIGMGGTCYIISGIIISEVNKRKKKVEAKK